MYLRSLTEVVFYSLLPVMGAFGVGPPALSA